MSEEQVCGKPTQVFSRVSGYYRPVQNWNDGKAQEFKERKTYDGQQAVEGEVLGGMKESTEPIETPIQATDEGTLDMDLDGLVLFASRTCPNCKMAKSFMDKLGVKYTELMSDENFELVKALDLRTAPTLVKFNNGKVEQKVASFAEIRKYIASLPADGEEESCESCKF